MAQTKKNLCSKMRVIDQLYILTTGEGALFFFLYFLPPHFQNWSQVELSIFQSNIRNTTFPLWERYVIFVWITNDQGDHSSFVVKLISPPPGSPRFPFQPIEFTWQIKICRFVTEYIEISTKIVKEYTTRKILASEKALKL